MPVISCLRGFVPRDHNFIRYRACLEEFSLFIICALECYYYHVLPIPSFQYLRGNVHTFFFDLIEKPVINCQKISEVTSFTAVFNILLQVPQVLFTKNSYKILVNVRLDGILSS